MSSINERDIKCTYAARNLDITGEADISSEKCRLHDIVGQCHARPRATFCFIKKYVSRKISLHFERLFVRNWYRNWRHNALSVKNEDKDYLS